MADFIDISAWQSDADLVAYRAGGYGIISLRATDGPSYWDAAFPSRWQLAPQIGLTRWAYHFARGGDPVAQANSFLQRVASAGGWRPGDIAMLDAEWFSSGGAWVGLNPALAFAYAREWFATIHAAAPAVKLLIYANAWYLEAAGITQANFPGLGWVVAAYTSRQPSAVGWDHACAWQFTDAARVPGLPQGVDCNHVTCPSAPPFGHLSPLSDGDLTLADIKQLEDYIDGTRDGLVKLIGGAVIEVKQLVQFFITAQGKRNDAVDKALAVQAKDIAAIKAKVGA
jgi:GH25 family lysozyme M1 (1,4-beta-N-acetylmuramidase)